MAVVRSLLSILCPAMAKIILSSWLKDNSLGKATGDEIVDKLKDFIFNPSEQEKTQRSIEKIAQQIVTQVQPIFDLEAASLSQDSRTAIQFEIVETLRQAEVTSELLMSFSLDRKLLTINLRNAYPEACKHFSRNETALYERMLEEVSRGIIEVAPELQGFTLAATTETLERLEVIINDLQGSRQQYQREKTEFERKYRQAIIRELDRMEMFGLPKMNSITAQQSLSKAYVTLSATRDGRDEQNKEAEIISRRLTEEIAVQVQQEENNSSRSSPVDETLASCRKIVIRGEAGAGKSTLLQWLAVRAAKQDFPSSLAPWNRLIPFFIRLRSLVDKGFPTPEEFPKLIAPNIADMMPKGWVHQCLDAGYALVLIDGVDELPRQQRQDFFEALTRLVADFPYARYIVTSRPAGLKDSQGETWQEWETWTEQAEFLNLSLRSMSPSNIEQFVTQWHEALAAAKRPEDQRIDLPKKGSDLQRLLRQRPELRRLATTPLLCAMICALHRDRGENLPTERIKLYQECIDMLLNSRDRGREIKLELDDSYPRGLSDSQKMALIQSFAYWMMSNNYSDVDISRVDEHFQKRLKLMNLPEQVTGQQIRALFVERAALLREPVIGKIDFAHRTFQEFLAAQAALNEDSLNVLLREADNDQWREAIIVAAGLGRPREQKELLQKLVQMGNERPDKRHYLHLLAVACLETTVELDPQVRTEVLKQAQALLPPKDDDEVLMVTRAGDAIVPLLAPNPNYSEVETDRCVDALAKIGSSAAMEILADYAKDTRYKLIGELGRAWDAFDRSTYASKVLSHLNEVYVPNLRNWEGFEHLQHINKLSIETLSLKDLSPLQELTNLTQLEISEADEVCNLTALEKNPRLTNLLLGNFFKNKIFRLDTNHLAKINNLNYLYLSNVEINEISEICQLFRLSELILERLEIRDISPLAQLPNLVSLGIFDTYGSLDLKFPNTFNNLACLYLAHTGISNLDLLSNVSNLKSLSILEDSISDLSPLANLNQLSKLSIGAVIYRNGGRFSYCREINVKSCLDKLYNLTDLRLNGTGINDISLLVSLPNLSNLILNENNIHDLNPLASLPNLISLSISEPNVRDISPLVNCQSLRRLYLGAFEMPYGRRSSFYEKTPITDISPLANLPHLTELVLGDTDVTDLSPLEGLPNLKIEILKD